VATNTTTGVAAKLASNSAQSRLQTIDIGVPLRHNLSAPKADTVREVLTNLSEQLLARKK